MIPKPDISRPTRSGNRDLGLSPARLDRLAPSSVLHYIAPLHEGIAARGVVTKETISFRIEREKKAALDGVAAELDRDRSYVINEAVDAYLEVRQWQLEHIREGLRQAQAGEFATEDEVRQAFARWRR